MADEHVSKLDKAKIEKLLGWLAVRLKEPSTYAGLGILAGAVGVHLDPGLAKYIAMAGAGLGGILAFFLPESSA